MEIYKAYTEGIYCDSPANRKLGRVGMSYQEYNEKQKNEVKKNYIIDFSNGETTMFSENTSKSEVVKLAVQEGKKIAEANKLEKYSFSLEEYLEEDSYEDFESFLSNQERMLCTFYKYKNKYEASVYDLKTNKFLINETLDRENKEIDKKYKEKQNKLNAMFDFLKDAKSIISAVNDSVK